MATQITFAVDPDTGLVISRRGSLVAWPIIDYDAMGPANNFAPSYYLECLGVFDVAREIARFRWTRKLPQEVKALHRAFWRNQRQQ